MFHLEGRQFSRKLRKLSPFSWVKAVRLPFETYPEYIHITPSIRENHDFYLYLREPHSLTETNVNLIFHYLQILFLSPLRKSKNINPSKIYKPSAKQFIAFLNQLSERNNFLPKRNFTPLVYKNCPKKTQFELPNIEQLRTTLDNPRHWLQTNTIKFHLFEYQLFRNLIFVTNTKNKFKLTSSSSEDVTGTNTNLFGIPSTKMLVRFSPLNFLMISSYLSFQKVKTHTTFLL